jgi:hypothetical protein
MAMQAGFVVILWPWIGIYGAWKVAELWPSCLMHAILLVRDVRNACGPMPY